MEGVRATPFPPPSGRSGNAAPGSFPRPALPRPRSRRPAPRTSERAAENPPFPGNGDPVDGERGLAPRFQERIMKTSFRRPRTFPKRAVSTPSGPCDLDSPEGSEKPRLISTSRGFSLSMSEKRAPRMRAPPERRAPHPRGPFSVLPAPSAKTRRAGKTETKENRASPRLGNIGTPCRNKRGIAAPQKGRTIVSDAGRKDNARAAEPREPQESQKIANRSPTKGPAAKEHGLFEPSKHPFSGSARLSAEAEASRRRLSDAFEERGGETSPNAALTRKSGAKKGGKKV